MHLENDIIKYFGSADGDRRLGKVSWEISVESILTIGIDEYASRTCKPLLALIW